MSTTKASHAAWAEVDHTDDPQFFVRFLDATRAPAAAMARQDPGAFFAYLDVHPGQTVLDTGCGLGEMARLIAGLVGPSGRVVGVDVSETMVQEARRRSAGTDLPVEFRQGDIMALEFAGNTCDRARVEQVLQHIPRPERGLAELYRVTKPGGRVAALEPDWDTAVIDAADIEMSRQFTRFNSESVAHGPIGRQLPRLFKEVGLNDVDVTPRVITPPYPAIREWIASAVDRGVEQGVMDKGRARAWLDDLAARDEDGLFFAAFVMFQVTGTVAV
jgi:ubiquinone/menaquinone biosynthesis C-methylase UbiE